LSEDERRRREVRAGLSALERTSQSLQRSHQVALETEAVGEATLADLGSQRETLERSQARMQETHIEIGRSEAVLRRIHCGAMQNKAILIAIIALEVLILLGLIYWKYLAKKSEEVVMA